MKKKRRAPSQKIRTLLQKEIQSKCPFCLNEDVDHFEVHHIDENPTNNAISNLMLLCPLCHSKITKGDISIEEVTSIKNQLMSSIPSVGEKVAMKINFNKSVKNAIVGNGNIVTIKNVKKTRDKYSDGSIGKQIYHKNYVSYLIDRYHQYKEYEVGKYRMNYSVFPSNLKKRYKIGKTNTIYNLPIELFADLISYVQNRIDETMLAKQLGRNHPNYSSFDEYIVEIKKRFPAREQD